LAVTIGIIGFGLMTAAFVMIARRGGWQKAMQGEDNRRWTLPRGLMVTGAFLCALFGVIASVANVLPWRESSPRNALFAALGAVLAAALIGITVLIQRWRGR